jgi:hypothetical protein
LHKKKYRYSVKKVIDRQMIINICSHYVCDCSLKIEADRLVSMEFIMYFVTRSLKMQLLLWCTLIDWLDHVFCMICAMSKRGAVPLSRYRDLLSSIPNMKHNVIHIMRKGEKQTQILDCY